MLANRRDVLKLASLGAAALPLGALQANAPARQDRAVIWVWLAGGPSQVETFDPRPDGPAAERSTTGVVQTNIPGVTFGGHFPLLAGLAEHLVIVRGFGHSVTSHGQAAHLMHTGVLHPGADDGIPQVAPSLAARVMHHRGVETPRGLSAAIRFGATSGDGPGRLGIRYQPREAADVQASLSRVPLAEQLQQALTWCERGVGHVAIHHPGWDMHADIAGEMARVGSELDHALAGLINASVERGLQEKVLVIVTGEFGRTRRLNRHAGRDHDPAETPLLLMGGGMPAGQVMDARDGGTLRHPADLMALAADWLGLPPAGQA